MVLSAMALLPRVSGAALGRSRGMLCLLAGRREISKSRPRNRCTESLLDCFQDNPGKRYAHRGHARHLVCDAASVAGLAVDGALVDRDLALGDLVVGMAVEGSHFAIVLGLSAARPGHLRRCGIQGTQGRCAFA